jgi:hypothetical protein
MGRPADALGRLQRLLAPAPGAGSPFFAVYTVPDLVEAAVRAGQPAATAPLAAFERLATMAGTTDLLAQLARCRGLIGPEAEAAGRFEEALALQEGQGRPQARPVDPQPAHPPGAPDRPAGGEGGTNREIGAQLFLSRRTIDTTCATCS